MSEDRNDRATLPDSIMGRVDDEGALYVWTNDDFSDLGSRDSVDRALQRLADAKLLLRPRRGYYYLSTGEMNSLTGEVHFPGMQSFLDAIIRRDRLTHIIDSHTAAHSIGLTTAVPARHVVYADTTPRTVAFPKPDGAEGVVIKFLPMLSKKRFWAGRPSMLFVQGLSWINDMARRGGVADGKIVDMMVNAIMQGRSREVVRKVHDDLNDNITSMPRWMIPIMQEVLPRVEAQISTLPSQDDDATSGGARP